MASVYDWSPAAADNATADDAINWAEGQPPSSVNNSARAMMGRLREFIADLGGLAAAGGSADALNVQSHAAVTAYKDGIIIRFRAAVANSAGVSLNLNRLGPRPLLKAGLQKAVPLEGGEIQPGGIYECLYNAGLAGGGWFLASPAFVPPKPAAAPLVPAGAVMPFVFDWQPEGWLYCNGAWKAQSDFPALYAAIGKHYGGNDWQFALPDLRGEFIRGWVGNRDMPIQSGRQLGSWERDKIIYHRHRGATGWSGEHSHAYSLYNQGNADGGGYHRGIGGDGRHNEQTGGAGNHQHNFTTDWGFDEDGRMGDETRPRNIALSYCIKC